MCGRFPAATLLAFLCACNPVVGDDAGNVEGATSGDAEASSGSADDGAPPPESKCEDLPSDGPTFGPGEAGPLWFPNTVCSPRFEEELAAAGPYRCCSDDPAASEGALPSYGGLNIEGGVPLFSGDRNAASIWGACVRVADIAVGLAEDEAAGCPVPCNPTWTLSDVETVCRAGSECCQTRELGVRDCVEVDGLVRPATGNDVLEHPELTRWSPGQHDTHQDVGGTACQEYAGAMDDPQFEDCVRQLTVANQRGFCRPAGSCPVDPSYVDPCTAMN